jgi:WD40 repeat protein
MKIDANSDGTVSWEEFSTYILEVGNMSDANSSKQGVGLCDPPTSSLYYTPHACTIAHVAWHVQAPRFATIDAEAKRADPSVGVGREGGGAGRNNHKDGGGDEAGRAAVERGPATDERPQRLASILSGGSKEAIDFDQLSRRKHERPVAAEIRLWNNSAEAGKALATPTSTSATLTGTKAVVLSTCVLSQRYELCSRAFEFILAVSSADSVVQFYDLDKLHLHAQMRTRDFACTSLMPFAQSVPGNSLVSCNFLACGDSKGRLHILKEQVIGLALGGIGGAGSSEVPEIDFASCVVSVTQLNEFQRRPVPGHEHDDSTGAGTGWRGTGGQGIGKEVTATLYVQAVGLVVCACADSNVYVLETRVGSMSLAGSLSRRLKSPARDPHKATPSRAGSSSSLLGHSRTSKHGPARLNEVFAFHGHHQAVKALVWCSATKHIASAGLDREIIMWEPTNGSVFGRLAGHKRSIVALEYRSVPWAKAMLMSVDKRGEVKLWDASAATLLMSIPTVQSISAAEKGGAGGKVGSILYNTAMDTLIFLTRKPLACKFQENKRTGELAMLEHKQALLDFCIDSEHFHQALCLDPSGLVTIWRLDNGAHSMSLYANAAAACRSRRHYAGADDSGGVRAGADDSGGVQEPTALSLDEACRRLLVGFSRGACQVYNYSNGSVIHELVSDATAEIKAITCTHASDSAKHEAFFVASGWNCVSYVWPAHSQERSISALFKLEPRGDVDNLESIACQISLPSSILLTGSQDGILRMWNLNTRVNLYTCQMAGKSRYVKFQHDESHCHSPQASASPPQLKCGFEAEKSGRISRQAEVSHGSMSMAELSRLESSEGGSRVMSLDDSDISNGVETFETSSNGRTQAPTHASICCMHLVSFPQLGATGDGNDHQNLILGVSDGWRLLSNGGIRWHPWGYCGLLKHSAWCNKASEATSKEVQEPSNAEKPESEAVLTSMHPIQTHSTQGRVLVCTGNSHGWIHVWDLSGIRKPKFWQDQMTNSGWDTISGEVCLADVSSEVTCLLRWQAYTDAPVARLKMVTQLIGTEVQLLVTGAGAEEETRTTERKRAAFVRELAKKEELDLGFDDLQVPGTSSASSAALGGATLWFLDGTLVGSFASIVANIEMQEGDGVNAENSNDAEEKLRQLSRQGWNAEKLLVHLFGHERAEGVVELAVAAEKHKFKLDKQVMLFRAAESAMRLSFSFKQAREQARATSPPRTGVISPTISSGRHGLHCHILPADSSRAVIKQIDDGALRHKREEHEFETEKRRRVRQLTSATKMKFRNQVQKPARSLSASKDVRVEAVDQDRERATMTKKCFQRPGAYFVADTIRKKLKQIDDEMEAFRFLSRNQAAMTPAIEMLSHQRETLIDYSNSKTPLMSPVDRGECSGGFGERRTVPSRGGSVSDPGGSYREKDGKMALAGIAAMDLGGAGGLIEQELFHVLNNAKASVTSVGKSLPRFVCLLVG